MSLARNILAVLTLAALPAGSVLAQDRGVSLSARGGGFNALTNLDEAGARDFNRTGYTVGGGLGVRVNPYVTLRGDFTFARNEFRLNDVATGTDVNRFFYDAAVQLQYPTTLGLEPYLFAGGGAVTIHEVGTSGQDETKLAGTFGLGLNYTVPGSGFGVFVEGKSWLYNPTDMTGVLAGVDKVQYEVAWTGGVSYRFQF